MSARIKEVLELAAREADGLEQLLNTERVECDRLRTMFRTHEESAKQRDAAAADALRMAHAGRDAAERRVQDALEQLDRAAEERRQAETAARAREEELSQRLAGRRAECDGLRDDLAKSVVIATDRERQQGDALAALQVARDAAERRVRDLSDTLDREREESRLADKTWKQAVADLQNHIETLKAQTVEATAQVQLAKTRADSQVAEAAARTAEVKASLESSQRRVQELQTALNDAEEARAQGAVNAQRVIAEMGQDVNGLKAQVAALTDEKRNIEVCSVATQTELRVKLERVEADKSSLQMRLDNANARVAGLAQEVENERAGHKRRNQDADSSDQRAAEASRLMENERKRAASAEAKIPQLEEQLQAAVRRAADAEERLKAFGPLSQVNAGVMGRDDLGRPISVVLAYADQSLPATVQDSFLILMPPADAVKKVPTAPPAQPANKNGGKRR